MKFKYLMIKCKLSFCRFYHATNGIERRTFASTIRPDERYNLPLIDFKGDAAQGFDCAIARM